MCAGSCSIHVFFFSIIVPPGHSFATYIQVCLLCHASHKPKSNLYFPSISIPHSIIRNTAIFITPLFILFTNARVQVLILLCTWVSATIIMYLTSCPVVMWSPCPWAYPVVSTCTERSTLNANMIMFLQCFKCFQCFWIIYHVNWSLLW